MAGPGGKIHFTSVSGIKMLSKYCEPQGVIFFQFLFYYLTSLYPVHEKTRWTHHHKYANLTKCFDCGLRCDAKVNPTLSFPCLVCFFKSTHGIHWNKNSLWIALEHFALKRFKDLIKSILNTSFSADNFFSFELILSLKTVLRILILTETFCGERQHGAK